MSDVEVTEDRPIWFLNRSVLVVRAREPFVDWACSVDDPVRVRPADAAASVNSFLIPEFGTEEESWAWIREHCDTVFELMLNDWYTDPELWPEDRGWGAFQLWFEAEHIDLAWDLVAEPLSSDPPPVQENGGTWDA